MQKINQEYKGEKSIKLEVSLIIQSESSCTETIEILEMVG